MLVTFNERGRKDTGFFFAIHIRTGLTLSLHQNQNLNDKVMKIMETKSFHMIKIMVFNKRIKLHSVRKS